MTSLNKKEVEKFAKIADEWWSENGKFKPLHKFNPVRITYIKKVICKEFNLDFNSKEPFKKLKIMDIGCGGGLISEPFAKMGAELTGIDASPENIEVANLHAENNNVKINYQHGLIEDIVDDKKVKNNFDVVLALEIVEHVDNVEDFLRNCSKMLKKDGLLFVATLNRTLKSLLTAKIGAEYVLKWLPAGTHEFKKFLKPSEIYSALENEVELKESCGFCYNIFKDQWKEDENDLDVNYVMVFQKS